MSAHDPQSFEMSAFNFFRELQPDTNDSHLALFLEHFEKELAEMQAYMDAHGCSEREAFEAVFCESTGEQASPEPCNRIPLPDETDIKVLPQPSTFEELKAQQPDFLKSDEWFGTPIAPSEWLDFTEAYTSPNFALSFRGRPFARLGDVQVISGQAGHGKSMLFSQIITALLKGEFGELRYELADSIPNPKILLIDTEQSKNDVIAGKNRVMELCGWGMQQTIDNFRVIMLRDTETAIGRWRKTLQSVYEVQPNFIILDGLLDVVEDFNAQTECAELIFKCLQTATHYKAAMMCVLHQNPLSTKLTGHLGSAAMRKVSDILVVSKDKKSDNIVFNVTQAKARGHQDIADWQFRVVPSLWGRPEQIGSISSDDIDIESIKQWLQDGQADIEWPAYESTIKTVIKERGNVRSNDVLQECIKRAKNRRFIVEQPREEWESKQKYPKYYLSL